MPAILHFNWIPKRNSEARPADQARAIKRGDTFARPVRLWEDTDPPKTTPRPITGVCRGQLRLKPVTGDDAGEPVADIEVDMTDAATGVLVLRMSADVTRGLPSSGVWDVENDLSGTITTLIGGKWKASDDVTREAE